MIKVRAPMLLDSQMNAVRRLEPASCGMTLNLTPPSTADLTIRIERYAPVMMREWIRLYNIHGDAGIYRVSASDWDYSNDEQRITLEHGITSLRDKIIPAPADPDDVEIIDTASAMLSYLLSEQEDECWQAGSCAATENVILNLDGSTLFDMLLKMMNQLPEYALSFDQSSFPWTVSIVTKPQSITAEGRLSRNLESARITYDDSDLCTRVLYNHNDETAYMDADTVGTYGIVEGSVNLLSSTQQAEATRILTRYLEKHKEPAVSIELDAVDLSEATGETIDAFTVGKKFRLTLPEYGVVVDQWITCVKYDDVYEKPDRVTLTLGNRIADIAQRAEKTQSMASSNAASARALHTRIIQTDSMIRLEAQRATAAEGRLNSSLTVTADAITAEVTRATAAEGTLSSRITQNATDITLKVSETDFTGNTIIGKINLTSTTATISASRIVLDAVYAFFTGTSTASNMIITQALIQDLYIPWNQGDTISNIRYTPAQIVARDPSTSAVTYFNSDTRTILIETGANTATAQSLNLQHYHAISASEDQNTPGRINITLGAVASTAQTTNFNIADTAFYQNAVSAATLAERNAWKWYGDASGDTPASNINPTTITGGQITESNGAYTFTSTTATMVAHNGANYASKTAQLTRTVQAQVNVTNAIESIIANSGYVKWNDIRISYDSYLSISSSYTTDNSFTPVFDSNGYIIDWNEDDIVLGSCTSSAQLELFLYPNGSVNQSHSYTESSLTVDILNLYENIYKDAYNDGYDAGLQNSSGGSPVPPSGTVSAVVAVTGASNDGQTALGSTYLSTYHHYDVKSEGRALVDGAVVDTNIKTLHLVPSGAYQAALDECTASISGNTLTLTMSYPVYNTAHTTINATHSVTATKTVQLPASADYDSYKISVGAFSWNINHNNGKVSTNVDATLYGYKNNQATSIGFTYVNGEQIIVSDSFAQAILNNITFTNVLVTQRSSTKATVQFYMNYGGKQRAYSAIHDFHDSSWNE